LQVLQDACSKFRMSFAVNKSFLRGIVQLAETTLQCAHLCKDSKRIKMGEQFFRTAAKHYTTALRVASSRSASHAGRRRREPSASNVEHSRVTDAPQCVYLAIDNLQQRLMDTIQDMMESTNHVVLLGATELCKALGQVFLADAWCRILWVTVLLHRVQVVNDKARFDFIKASTQAAKKLIVALRLDPVAIENAIIIADEQWRRAQLEPRLYYPCAQMYFGM
jgi:hypothetical protein